MREINSPPKLKQINNKKNDFYVSPTATCIIAIFGTVSMAFILKIFNY
jgi:hypothetical protein